EFYLESGNLEFANDVLVEALVVAQENFGFENISTTELLQLFATLYMFQEKFDDAESTLMRVRRIMEEAYGTEDPRLRPVLEQTGSLYLEMGREEEAAMLFAEASVLPQETP
ncbi:MAG: tetratricopeptide repeat protein, partial [Dehalococcoidia bacterium]